MGDRSLDRRNGGNTLAFALHLPSFTFCPLGCVTGAPTRLVPPVNLRAIPWRCLLFIFRSLQLDAYTHDVHSVRTHRSPLLATRRDRAPGDSLRLLRDPPLDFGVCPEEVRTWRISRGGEGTGGLREIEGGRW